jgi:hypothetical protein
MLRRGHYVRVPRGEAARKRATVNDAEKSIPRGPRGQKRPADVIARAVMVARIATGEEQEALPQVSGKVRSGSARR